MKKLQIPRTPFRPTKLQIRPAIQDKVHDELPGQLEDILVNAVNIEVFDDYASADVTVTDGDSGAIMTSQTVEYSFEDIELTAEKMLLSQMSECEIDH